MYIISIFFRHGQELVDQTCNKIKNRVEEGGLKEGEYTFLRYLMSRKDISYKELSIVALSLFADGLSTVSIIRCNAMLSNAMQFNTTQCNATQYKERQDNKILFCTVQHDINLSQMAANSQQRLTETNYREFDVEKV